MTSRREFRIATPLLFLMTIGGLWPAAATARQATVDTEHRVLLTYPYHAPDPVPMLARDVRLYPYHAWDGYSLVGTDSAWTVLRLENDEVVAWVLPDVGGKIWGAVEKAGGREFIYRNEVMKFRNIALRGPWTSGGIELNFGVIGHAPWTASPVDYVVERLDDGSVAVVVGAMDVPSRTFWRVRISLPPEGAYLQTETLWYNPTPFTQPYYNWMTAAASARDDLRLIVPGNRYLRHSGEALPWPVDERGRLLSRYAENTFDGHKSYHVVGDHRDFFGGYYETDDWGFGHWAPYRDMPGQKMWLWALSDEGGIWEDLLTDTDGQYVEWQAGRLLVQYSPGIDVNPVTQVAFEPRASDRWTERWFPVVGMGGMSEASDLGALHVTASGNDLVITLNAFVQTTDTLVVTREGAEILRRPVTLHPLEPSRLVVRDVAPDEVLVTVPGLNLRYEPGSDRTLLKRPFTSETEITRPEADRLAFEARELARARRYGEASELLDAALAVEPFHVDALKAKAELDLRAGLADSALESIGRLLRMDTYDPAANWLAGLAYRTLGELTDAEESFGWAARSVTWRSAAFTALAEMALSRGEPERAAALAATAASYDPDAFGALQVRAVAFRLLGRSEDAGAVRRTLLTLDPLHHFAHAEAWLSDPTPANREQLVAGIRGELPEQTWLELAFDYVRRGRGTDGLALLGLAPPHPMVTVVRAWLAANTDPGLATRLLAEANGASPGFVFPFRPESVPVLEWAGSRQDGWRFDYWLALNFWALDRKEEAADLFRALADRPDYGPAYAARAALLSGSPGYRAESDLRRAVALDRDTQQLRLRLIGHLSSAGRWAEALGVAEEASARFPHVFDISLARARALLEVGRTADAVAIMDSVHVLPSEMGRASRRLYEWAHLTRGLELAESGTFGRAAVEVRASLEWPTRLGQGRPYDADERLQHGLLAWLAMATGDDSGASAHADSVLAWTEAHPDAPAAPAALVHPVLTHLDRTADAAHVRDLVGSRPEEPLARLAADLLNGDTPDPMTDDGHPDHRILARSLELVTTSR